MTSNTPSNPPSSRPMTLRQQLDDTVQDFLHDYTHGYETAKQLGQNVEYHTFDTIVGFLDDLEALCQEIAREAYKKGYVAGGIDEILRHEDARKTVLAELTHTQEEK